MFILFDSVRHPIERHQIVALVSILILLHWDNIERDRVSQLDWRGFVEPIAEVDFLQTRAELVSSIAEEGFESVSA